jgi:hypothetical protein
MRLLLLSLLLLTLEASAQDIYKRGNVYSDTPPLPGAVKITVTVNIVEPFTAPMLYYPSTPIPLVSSRPAPQVVVQPVVVRVDVHLPPAPPPVYVSPNWRPRHHH